MPRKSQYDPAPDETFDDEEMVEAPSKSQLKREMDALQDLGVALIDLGRDQLKKLDLPEKLLTAVLDAKRITANSAIKRQRQYIGRLMRDIDPAPIQAYLAHLRGDNDRQTAWLHRIERTRDELLADDQAVARLIDEHPGIDIQQLRQMVRNARAERAAQKPPKSFRLLFQFLKTLYPEPALVPAAEEEEDAGDEDDEWDEEDRA